MASWFNKHLLSKKVVDHRAVFLCKLLATSIDEAVYEQVRSRLMQSAGVETRVRLTVDGWTSGSKKTSRNIPIEFYPIESIEAVTADPMHVGVVICVIRCFNVGAGGGTLGRRDSAPSIENFPFQIIAYKFDDEAIPRRYVNCFESIRQPPASSSERQSTTKKSKFSKKKKRASGNADDLEIVVEPQTVSGSGVVETACRKKQGFLPGRPANAGGKLAADRWTVKDRSTPRLFASASFEDLLGESVTDDGFSTGRQTAWKKQQIERAKSYDVQVDTGINVEQEADENDMVEYHLDTINSNENGNDELDDMDEDAAAAGADFWKDDDDGLDDPARRFAFRVAAVPADIVLRRPLAATAGAWSSLDNIADRRSVDDWSTDESSEGEMVRCRDVAVTARFPAATDPKSRPERIDCFRFETCSDVVAVIGGNVADAQCQVDLPRLRPGDADQSNSTGVLSGYSSNTIESNISRVRNLNVRYDDDDWDFRDDNGDDDDDGWDFGDDDKSTATDISTTATLGGSSMNCDGNTYSEFPRKTFKTADQLVGYSPQMAEAEVFTDVERPFSKKVVTGSPSTRERLPSKQIFAAVPTVVAVTHHRRHHSDSGGTLLSYQTRERMFMTSSQIQASGHRRPRPKTFYQKTGSPRATTHATRPAASGHRTPSRLAGSSTSGIVYVKPDFERHYRPRTSSSSTSSSSKSGVHMSPVAAPMSPGPPPPPPPPPPALGGPLTVRIPSSEPGRRQTSISSPGLRTMSPTTPGLPSPPPLAAFQQQPHMRHHQLPQQDRSSISDDGDETSQL